MRAARQPTGGVRRGLLLLASWTLASVAYGQDDTGNQVREYPYAMPELPALTFIDAGAPKITRPVMPRALATEIVNGIDSAGRVKQGLAIAIAPWALLGQKITLKDYQTRYGQYLAANTQVSLGTVRVAGNAAATDLGLGLRLTMLDKSDPMRSTDFTDSVRIILFNSLPKTNPQDLTDLKEDIPTLTTEVTNRQATATRLHTQAAATPGAAAKNAALADAAAADAATAAAMARLAAAQSQLALLTLQIRRDDSLSQAATAQIIAFRQRWKRRNWSATSFSVAGAMGWRLNESELAPAPDNRLQGWSAWATLGLPLSGTAGQLLVQGRYTYRRQVAAADAPTQADGQFQYGARAVFGSASLNFYLEVTGTTHSTPLPGTDKARGDWAGGIEFRTTEGMWVSTGLGHRLPSTGTSSEPTLLFAGLRWQVASAARFAPDR